MTKNKPFTYRSWEHDTWGNAFTIMNWQKRDIAGHLQRIPNRGDYILFRMESGKILRCRVITVRKCGDPRDMFFATLSQGTYVKHAKHASGPAHKAKMFLQQLAKKMHVD